MKEKEYEVIAHIEDDDDIVEVCNEDYMIETSLLVQYNSPDSNLNQLD
jgi:hypothetical protein